MTLTRPVDAPVAEPVSPIKPSEALRLGRLTRPLPLRGDFLDGELAACALGAIGTGLGWEEEAYETWGVWKAIFPDAKEVPCPAEDCGPNMPSGMVAHLNDDHNWNDDQIVSWLESQGL